MDSNLIIELLNCNFILLWLTILNLIEINNNINDNN